MRRGVLVVLPLLAVGVAGALALLVVRESDAAFVFRQQHSRTIEPTEVALAVKTAREPVFSGKGSQAVAVSCRPGRLGDLRNPWSCRVRYASGRRVRYTLTIAPDGGWSGVDRTGDRHVRGCCFTIGH
jgi:hypothetical protein